MFGALGDIAGLMKAAKDLQGNMQRMQEQLAAKLKMRQASVSKLERQSDMLISTLEKLISALGAHLVLIAKVGDAHVQLTQFQRRPPHSRKRAGRRKIARR